jgi:hypothetical protein
MAGIQRKYWTFTGAGEHNSFWLPGEEIQNRSGLITTKKEEEQENERENISVDGFDRGSLA